MAVCLGEAVFQYQRGGGVDGVSGVGVGRKRGTRRVGVVRGAHDMGMRMGMGVGMGLGMRAMARFRMGSRSGTGTGSWLGVESRVSRC